MAKVSATGFALIILSLHFSHLLSCSSFIKNDSYSMLTLFTTRFYYHHSITLFISLPFHFCLTIPFHFSFSRCHLVVLIQTPYIQYTQSSVSQSVISSVSLFFSYCLHRHLSFSPFSSFDWLLNGTLLRHPLCWLAVRFLASSPINGCTGLRDFSRFLSILFSWGQCLGSICHGPAGVRGRETRCWGPCKIMGNLFCVNKWINIRKVWIVNRPILH